MNYKIEQGSADNGEQVFVYRDEQKNIPLNSLYSPEKEAQKFVKQHHVKNKVFVLIGMGNGAIVKEWLKQDDLLYLYVVEPYTEIPLVEELTPHLSDTTRMSFEYFKEGLEGSSLQYRAVMEKYSGVDVEFHFHPHYVKTDSVYLKDVITKLRNGTELIQLNVNTQRKFRKDWVFEPLFNLEYTMEMLQITHLKGAFKGERAVLAAAGPSLKHNIELVKQLQQSSYIFAAGSAINGLLNNGITPDFVCTYDSGLVNYETHFKDVQYSGPLIIESVINHHILAHHDGPVVLIGAEIDWISRYYLPELLLFKPVPSVANMTLQVLQYLGFSEIYLIGQDLALVDGKYYSDGVHNHAESVHVEATLEVENNMGGKVPTNHQLYAFLETFVSMIRLIEPYQVKVFNLSKHGAKIAGAPYVELSPEDLAHKRKEIELKIPHKHSTETGRDSIQSFMGDLEELHEELQKARKKVSYFKEDVASEEDLKKMLKHLKNVRKLPLYENVILQQFSFRVLRLSNIFQYGFDKEEYSNQDRVRMIQEIKALIMDSANFVEELLKDQRYEELKEKYYVNK